MKELSAMQSAMLRAQVRASLALRKPDIYKPGIPAPMPKGKRELPIDWRNVRGRSNVSHENTVAGAVFGHPYTGG